MVSISRVRSKPPALWMYLVVMCLAGMYYFLPFVINESILEASELVTLDTASRARDRELLDRVVARKLPPVSCSQVLLQARTGKAFDPNGGKLYSRYTVDEPYFWISVHNWKYDRVRFGMFEEYGFYYERELSRAFGEVLSESEDARVLDVGGNIGWFSLLSAALGAQVASFEPHQANYLRTCESMCLNGWLHSGDAGGCMKGSVDPFLQEAIHIFPYAVSDQQGMLHLQQTNRANPGQGAVTSVRTANSTAIKAVSLDGMVDALGWSHETIDILKVDVEGVEEKVFAGAKKLLRSNRVKNIFMEGNIRTDAEKASFERIVKILVDSGYVLYKLGGWVGPDSTDRVPEMTADFFPNLFTACGTERLGVARNQCNLWWKAPSAL